VILELNPYDVAHGGYCVGRHEGVVVMVTGTLPGERIRAEVMSQRSNVWYARTTGVLEASPDRIPHVWPEAEAGAGGADLGHVSPAAGRAWKARVIENQMLRIAHCPVDVVVEAAPGDDARGGLAWRTRVSLRVDSGRLGVSGAKSHEFVPITSMPLAHEDIQARIESDIAEHGDGSHVSPGQIRIGGRSRGRGRVRRGTGERLNYVRASAPGSGVIVAEAGVGSEPLVTEIVEVPAGTWSYQVAAGGFWQVHSEAPAVLLQAVLEAVGTTAGPLYDLYAGAGLFSVPLADTCGSPVTAVEYAPNGVAALRLNAAGHQVKALSGAVEEILPDLEGSGGVVVLDPPRSGAGRAAITEIVRLAPDKVVYVACDPAALARDAGLMMGAGYRLAALRAFDLFPMTHHVECVAVLTR